MRFVLHSEHTTDGPENVKRAGGDIAVNAY